MKRWSIFVIVVILTLQISLWLSFGEASVIQEAFLSDIEELRAKPPVLEGAGLPWILCDDAAWAISPKALERASEVVGSHGGKLYCSGFPSDEEARAVRESCVSSSIPCYFFCYKGERTSPLMATLTVSYGQSSWHEEVWIFLIGRWVRVSRTGDVETLLSG